ncbi:peptidoglycan-binding protein [Leifsonia aquatica]|uniref:peptidoglycan-binding protein n=1 Tax=Leifsonia aquatica TaxID=144185 RepID=UPI000469A7FC|nr:peptidoglycan-binding protein [Leifsonia aquatica]
MTYANGQIPASELVQAANGAPGQVLERQTAAQWAAMVAAAASDGITLRPAADDGVPSCYRDLAGQREADRRAKAGGPVAATPGFSNHGLGCAVDVYMGAGVKAWLDKNAARFGFDNVQGKSSGESWHWVRTVIVGSTITPGYGAGVQTKLNAKGYKLAVDDKIGATTVAALRDFQSKNGLTVDGLFGPKSEAALGGAPAVANPAPTASGRPQIKKGSKGQDVKDLQTRLKTVYPLYAGNLVLDGDFGSNTDAAVREFQRRAGLYVDGIVGDKTWKALGL